MKPPTLLGLIDRRILVNFTVDPGIVAGMLPGPFRPKTYKNKAIIGICLIRLKHIRPKGFPAFTGIASENGAHRIAVEWDEGNVVREGVYIPRRDTASRLNAWLGGRLFPGRHHLAQFRVEEGGDRYQVAFTSADGAHMAIDAQETTSLSPSSVFETLPCCSSFFEQGACGYSPNGTTFEGMKLTIPAWQVRPLRVSSVYVSLFEDESLFPKGSVVFDNALIMTGMASEWRALEDK
ncbi:DUF2071 domain-containing protein [Taibaiella koreensis]|uniref:DUF2071 domain-containing protein n=1 Tax=Taibaiella koreensis TaxID=1268548 RepID=UPI000E59AE19|nr:DUF2071 domain-containing protein [Taibaiella koreensis]